MPKLTEKAKTDYVNGNYNSCPHCGSESITGGHIEADDNFCWRPVNCDDCEESWTETFTMTSIEDDE